MAKKFLDASLVPLEKALLTRADILSSGMIIWAPEPATGNLVQISQATLNFLAAEFRALAKELREQ